MDILITIIAIAVLLYLGRGVLAKKTPSDAPILRGGGGGGESADNEKDPRVT